MSTYFNDDISGWDTRNVKTMRSMFAHAQLFDQPIGRWNTGKVEKIKRMFAWQNISGWPDDI